MEGAGKRGRVELRDLPRSGCRRQASATGDPPVTADSFPVKKMARANTKAMDSITRIVAEFRPNLATGTMRKWRGREA